MDFITTQFHPHGPEPRHPCAPEVQTNNERLCEGTDKPLSHSTCCTFSLFCPTFNQLMILRSQNGLLESNICRLKETTQMFVP